MLPLKLEIADLQRIEIKIKDFIRRWVRAANADGAAVALSGGVDSAVVAKLAHDTANLKVLILPEIGVTPQRDIIDALTFATSYSIPYQVVRINEIIRSIRVSRGALRSEEIKDQNIVAGNIKARVRMILNYIVANSENRLVLGTGNRSELLVGYFTKYGDGAVDILPIGNLYKTQVVQLAEYLGIPSNIIKKVPSAGLWIGQSDEEELGISYNDLDKILSELLDKRANVERAATELRMDKNKIIKVYQRVLKSKHKLRMPPIASVE